MHHIPMADSFGIGWRNESYSGGAFKHIRAAAWIGILIEVTITAYKRVFHLCSFTGKKPILHLNDFHSPINLLNSGIFLILSKSFSVFALFRNSDFIFMDVDKSCIALSLFPISEYAQARLK